MAAGRFDTSLVKKIDYRPWRIVNGARQELDGVFLMLSDTLVDWLVENVSAAVKQTLQSYVYFVTAAQAAEWNVPIWAGERSAVFLRVPANVWNDPTSDPPQAVKNVLKSLWVEANNVPA